MSHKSINSVDCLLVRREALCSAQCKIRVNLGFRVPYIGEITILHEKKKNQKAKDIRCFYTFKKCDVANCKIKCSGNRMVLPSNNFKSHVNRHGFVIFTDENLNCLSSNIVYLISCRVCGVQYVGETSRSASVRWAEHLYKIRKGDQSQLIYSHFNCDDAHNTVVLSHREL